MEGQFGSKISMLTGRREETQEEAEGGESGEWSCLVESHRVNGTRSSEQMERTSIKPRHWKPEIHSFKDDSQSFFKCK